MTAKFFVDTNILVYAASVAVADQARRDLSLDLLDRSDLALSALSQCLSYTSNSRSAGFVSNSAWSRLAVDPPQK